MQDKLSDDTKKISPVRISQWIVDKLIADTYSPMQYLLHGENYSPEQLEYLHKIRLLQLSTQAKVRNIAELYGEEDDISSLRLAVYNPKEYLSALINQIISLINNRKVEIILNWDDNCKGVVLDARRTNIIIYNLISNAVIHSKNATKLITVNAFMRGDDFVISVSDNGRKISVAKQKKLFSAFEHSLTVKTPKMIDPLCLSGLGLSVCRKAARDMDGDVVFVPSSKFNIFELSIPQRRKIGMFYETTVFVPVRSEAELYMSSAMLHLLNLDT